MDNVDAESVRDTDSEIARVVVLILERVVVPERSTVSETVLVC